ncbi:hypothetical protein ACC728_36465, partial [Rhizobium ruizarguesonis]
KPYLDTKSTLTPNTDAHPPYGHLLPAGEKTESRGCDICPFALLLGPEGRGGTRGSTPVAAGADAGSRLKGRSYAPGRIAANIVIAAANDELISAGSVHPHDGLRRAKSD